MYKTLLALALLAGTAGTRATAQADLPRARRELLAADSALARAVASGLADGYAGGLLPAADFLPPRADVLQGAAAVREYLSASPVYASASWQPVRADVSADGASGYTLDFGSVVRRDNGSTLQLRQIAFWQRDAAGHWGVRALLPAVFPSPSGEVPTGFGTPESALGHPAPGAKVDELLAADRAFAALAQPANVVGAFVTYAAPTAALVSGPNWGPAGAGEGVNGPSISLQWAPEHGAIAGSGDLGYTVGYATMSYTGEDGTPVHGRTKYLTIWQRQADGSWRFVADGGTSRAAVTP